MAENFADTMQTSTLDIAEISAKAHKHVLRDLKASKIPAKECTYIDARNREQKYYLLTKPQAHAFLLSYKQETRVKIFEELTKRERSLLELAERRLIELAELKAELEFLRAEVKTLAKEKEELMAVIRKLKPGGQGSDLEKVTIHTSLSTLERDKNLAVDMLAGAISIANTAIALERLCASFVSYEDRAKIQDFKSLHEDLKPINPHCVLVYKHMSEVKRLHDLGLKTNHSLGIRADTYNKGYEHLLLKAYNKRLGDMLQDFKDNC